MCYLSAESRRDSAVRFPLLEKKKVFKISRPRMLCAITSTTPAIRLIKVACVVQRPVCRAAPRLKCRRSISWKEVRNEYTNVWVYRGEPCWTWICWRISLSALPFFQTLMSVILKHALMSLLPFEEIPKHYLPAPERKVTEPGLTKEKEKGISLACKTGRAFARCRCKKDVGCLTTADASAVN